MPKKKETKKSTEVTGKATSGVNYTGKVTIQKVSGGKVLKKTTIRNSGCLPLFKFFSNCVTLYSGDNVQALLDSKPQYINGYYLEPPLSPQSKLSTANEALRAYVRQSGITSKSSTETTIYDSGNSYSELNIKFLIQDNNFKDPNIKINTLGLFGANNVGLDGVLPHAYIVINKQEDYLTYGPGVNYIITWVLRISN